jgi:rubrerythrin
VRLDRRGVLVAAAAGSAALASGAAAQRGSDAEVMARLLSLERGLGDLYEAAGRRGALDRALAERLTGHEREHADGLERALRGAGPAPRASVPSPALNRALAAGGTAFLRYALRLELEAVAAYADAVTSLRDPRLLQPLGSIMAAEGQHLAALRAALGTESLTRAFETGQPVG